MVQSERAVLIDCGQRNQGGSLQLFEKETGQELVLLLFHSPAVVMVNQQSYHFQPFTFALYPFENGILQIVLQDTAVFSWLHLRVTNSYQQQLQHNGLTYRMEHLAMQPLAIMEIFKILASVKDAASALEQEIARTSLELMLCLLLQNIQHSERAVHIPHYEKLVQLRSEIYQHPEKSWYIQDICNRLCISRPYFHKIYLMAFGTSCTQDVIESRIACSKQLLERTDLAITEISQRSGFESDVYFMRQFKRHAGMTPTAYRRVYQQSYALSDMTGRKMKKNNNNKGRQ